MNALMFLTQLILAGATTYFVVEAVQLEREESLPGNKLFNPPKTAPPGPKELAGSAH